MHTSQRPGTSTAGCPSPGNAPSCHLYDRPVPEQSFTLFTRKKNNRTMKIENKNRKILRLRCLILFFLPFGVISIYPGNYKIYWFFFSPVHFFSHLQSKKCLRHSPVIYYIFLLPAFRFFFSAITLFFIYIPSYLLISIT